MAHQEGEGVTRRDALECMIWAGTGVLWTMAGGIPKSALLGSAQAAEAGFSFLLISHSHVGFDKPANPSALGALQEAIGKIVAKPALAGKYRSKALDADDRFGITFDKPGEFAYFCGLRPQMKGKIIVAP